MTLAEGKDLNAVKAKWDSVCPVAGDRLMQVFRFHAQDELGGVSCDVSSEEAC